MNIAVYCGFVSGAASPALRFGSLETTRNSCLIEHGMNRNDWGAMLESEILFVIS